MNSFSWNVQVEKILGYLKSEINKKSGLIDPVEYENPKRLDDINKAINGAEPAVVFCFFTSGLITRYVTFFIFMGFYLINLKPTLILCLLFAFIPVMISHVLQFVCVFEARGQGCTF